MDAKLVSAVRATTGVAESFRTLVAAAPTGLHADFERVASAYIAYDTARTKAGIKPGVPVTAAPGAMALDAVGVAM